MAYSKEKQRIYHKKWTEQNKEKRYSANLRWRQRSRDWYHDYKKNLKCEKCNEDHPACLEFHHTDPTVKEGNIGSKAGHWSIKRILKEIEKCIVLCSNCHKKLHYKN